MSFAKLPTQAPQFDATALMNALKASPALAKQFIGWKRWVEATTEQDGKGLRDTVAANAQGLNAVKADTDGLQDKVDALTTRVTALEGRPQTSFPGPLPQ